MTGSLERVAVGVSQVGLGLFVAATGVLLALALDRRRGGDAAGAFTGWLGYWSPQLADWMRRRLAGVPGGLARTIAVLLGIAAAWLFLSLAEDARSNEELVHIDRTVEAFVLSHRSVAISGMMRSVTVLGSYAWLLVVALVAAVVLLVLRRWKQALVVIVALELATLGYQVLKSMIERPRPLPGFRLTPTSGFSFPSGHAAATVATFGAIAIVFSVGRALVVRVVIWTCAVALAVLVAMSRVYLGLHWTTDVLAGAALGCVCLCLPFGLFPSLAKAPPSEAVPQLAPTQDRR